MVEPEETAVARERPIYTFPRQQTRDATTEELLKGGFSTGSVPRLYNESVGAVR
jgi:hypothetical protein